MSYVNRMNLTEEERPMASFEVETSVLGSGSTSPGAPGAQQETKTPATKEAVVDKRSNYFVFTSKAHRADLAEKNNDQPLSAQQLSSMWKSKTSEVCDS